MFETDRLVIRHMRLFDLDAFHDIQGAPNVMRFVKSIMNQTEWRKKLQRFIGYWK